MSVASLLGCASQQKKDSPVVRDVHISGNDEISSRQIKKKILTAETGWWPFAHKQHFDSVTWQSDLKRIERLYVANGFYQAEVVKDEVRPDPPDGVELEVQVSEGKPTKVGKLDVAFEGPGPTELTADDRAAAQKDLPLAPGKVFREEDWAATKRLLADRLRNRGYAKASVEGRALVDVKTQLANLTLTVSPGRRYVFGDIQVDTAPGARIPAHVVWEQAHLAIEEGRPFSDSRLEEAQRRLFGMGVFATIRVAPGEADEANGRLPVRVIVREGPFRTLRLGAGARADAIRNEARLVGDWSHRDFLGGMRKLTVHAELGWAFLPNVYAVATDDQSVGPRNGPIARLRFEFEQPRFLGRPSLRWRNSLEIDRTLEQTYDALSNRLMTGVVWQWLSTLSIFPSYRLEADYLDGAPINSAATAPLTLGCETTSDHCFVWLSYLDTLIQWDRRDHLFDPRKGTYLSLDVQGGGGPLGGNFDYVRVLPDARAYYSFGSGNELTLSTRLRWGQLWPWSGNPDDSAVVTRFYAGGSISMRGFSDRRLSPLLLVPPPPGAPDVLVTVPIGGNGLIDGSFEARYSLTSSLRAAVFVDFGQVTRARFQPGDIPNVLWAVGVGVRWITPIGPIRVDLARRLPFGELPTLYAVDPLTGAIVPRAYSANDSCFGLFGSNVVTPVTDSLCALHFAIGEAF
jgi:translocation and assembly module TamA